MCPVATETDRHKIYPSVDIAAGTPQAEAPTTRHRDHRHNIGQAGKVSSNASRRGTSLSERCDRVMYSVARRKLSGRLLALAPMVYLDYNASTPVDPRVMSAVVQGIDEFGNASSLQHHLGQSAAEIIEEARTRVGDLVERPGRDVVFTSGASEAAAIGIIGAMLGAPGRPNVVVGATEHKAILSAAAVGARLTGGTVRTLRVDRSGNADLSHLKELVDDSVSVVAVMAANNETGVVAPLATVGEAARGRGALSVIDITQLAGKGSLSSVHEHADIMFCSSHKIYGPKGAGALVASRHVQRSIVSILAGGGQEHGLRGGTLNTASIAGFGLAAELSRKEQDGDALRIGRLADELLAGLTGQLGGVEVNGAGAERLSNTLNLRFVGADSEAVMASMPRLAVSAGSACQSATPTQSHVLLAMGMSSTAASESLRISLGRPTTSDEIHRAVDQIVSAVARVRLMTTRSEVQQ
jgi:cysteine desulfurase